MAKTLHWAAIVIGVLYLLALFLWAVGTFGWFGQEPDPLSAVFLIPIGLPWNRFGEGLAIALLAPLANVAILEGLSRLLTRRAV